MLDLKRGVYGLDTEIEIQVIDYQYCPRCGKKIEVEVVNKAVREKFMPKIEESYFIWSEGFKQVMEFTYSQLAEEDMYMKYNNCFRNREEAEERGRILELKDKYEYKVDLKDYQTGLLTENTVVSLVYNKAFKRLQWRTLDSWIEEFEYDNNCYPIETIIFENRCDYIDFNSAVKPEEYAYYILGLC